MLRQKVVVAAVVVILELLQRVRKISSYVVAVGATLRTMYSISVLSDLSPHFIFGCDSGGNNSHNVAPAAAVAVVAEQVVGALRGNNVDDRVAAAPNLKCRDQQQQLGSGWLRRST